VSSTTKYRPVVAAYWVDGERVQAVSDFKALSVDCALREFQFSRRVAKRRVVVFDNSIVVPVFVERRRLFGSRDDLIGDANFRSVEARLLSVS
jgi:hypothetical protein